MVDDGRTTDGRRLDGYTISSRCEPNGTGELKRSLVAIICGKQWYTIEQPATTIKIKEH